MQPAALLAAIVESSDDAIVTKDLTGRITTWNAAAERLFGYEASEAIGRHVTLVIPADRLAEETFVMARVLEGVGISHFETVRLRKDGALVDVSLTVSPIRDRGGRIVGASKIARDITAQKVVAARLNDEMRIVETLDRIAAVVTGTLERDRVVEVIAEAAAEVTGATWGAFIHRSANTDPSHAARMLSGTPSDVFRDVPGATIDNPFGTDGRDRRVTRVADLELSGRAAAEVATAPAPTLRSYLSVPAISRSGTAFGRVFLGHPHPWVFTERHERLVLGIMRWGALALDNAQLYLEAQQANRLKDEFLATLSHELRTPLNAIMGWAHILGSGQTDERTRERAVSTIQRNARAQSRLVDDLIDVSRIVSGRFQLEFENVNLKSVISMAVEDIRPAAAEREVELRTSFEGDVVVRGDSARLQQVVWNLLSNAVKFTTAPGHVVASLTRDGDRARILVADTGQGIPPDFLDHVFDRFRQADATATRRHGGLGLGLGIVKHLVEAHGGTVRATSGGQGQGAAFVVEMPAVDMFPAGVESRVQSGRARLAGLRVLAVDDERDAADMMAVALRSAGAEVVTAYAAREALAHEHVDEFDVVLADIGMPGMDGYALMHELRTHPRDRRFLGVAVTAFASPEERKRALEAGFDLHLAKPIPPEDVVSAIARALDVPESP